jgi:hypothetical protein
MSAMGTAILGRFSNGHPTSHPVCVEFRINVPPHLPPRVITPYGSGIARPLLAMEAAPSTRGYKSSNFIVSK